MRGKERKREENRRKVRKSEEERRVKKGKEDKIEGKMRGGGILRGKEGK